MPSTRVGSGSVSSCLGVGDERAVRGRPGHPMGGGDLGHRAGRLADRRADRVRNRPVVRARAGTCAIVSVNDATLAVVLPASPPSLVPPHNDSVLTVGDVTRRRGHPALHRGGHHPARRARRRRLPPLSPHAPPGSRRQALNTLNPYSWQPEQQCRTVGHSPWSLPPSDCFATFRLRKAKGLLMQRHALVERNHNCPFKIEEP